MHLNLSRYGKRNDHSMTGSVSAGQVKDFVAMADEMMVLAVKTRASDVHLEPYFFTSGNHQTAARIRFRIDGVLQTVQYLDQTAFSGMVTRLKVLGKMNITEKRLPQDGKFDFKGIDVRVSSIPDIRGEKLVLRLLSGFRTIKTIGEIGMSDGQMRVTARMIQRGRGLILVCGPTGCGKSTTLYALMKKLSNEQINIISIEDPVEIAMNGISQIQLQEKIGLNYTQVLKGMMRQDPDVLMIGEIRDEEVAREAVRFAMTGHQVFTTLHTTNALGSVKRLMEMGIPTYLISDVLTGVIAQRLVRRLCPNCKTPYLSGEKEAFLWQIPPGTTLYRPKGCEKCSHTGYYDRIGVFEMLEIDEIFRTALTKGRVNVQRLKQNGKFQDFEQSMRKMLLSGITSAAEGVRIFGLEKISF